MATYKQEIVLTKWVAELRFDQMNFIAEKYAMKVPTQGAIAGIYYEYEKAPISPVNDRMSPKGESRSIESRGKFAERQFTCYEYGLSDGIRIDAPDVLNRSQEEQAKEVVAKLVKTRRLNKEIQFKALLDVATSSAVDNPWDTEAATIEKDLSEKCRLFGKMAGIMPNAIIIPYNIWEVMVMNPEFRGLFQLKEGDARKDSDVATIIKRRFPFIKEIVIPILQYNDESTGDVVDLWDVKDIWLLSIGGEKDKDTEEYIGTPTEFTYISKFEQKKETVASWLSENGKIKYYEVSECYDLRVICPNACLKITGVLS
jgi:hypothetical protein